MRVQELGPTVKAPGARLWTALGRLGLYLLVGLTVACVFGASIFAVGLGFGLRPHEFWAIPAASGVLGAFALLVLVRRQRPAARTPGR